MRLTERNKWHNQQTTSDDAHAGLWFCFLVHIYLFMHGLFKGLPDSGHCITNKTIICSFDHLLYFITMFSASYTVMARWSTLNCSTNWFIDWFIHLLIYLLIGFFIYLFFHAIFKNTTMASIIVWGNRGRARGKPGLYAVYWEIFTQTAGEQTSMAWIYSVWSPGSLPRGVHGGPLFPYTAFFSVWLLRDIRRFQDVFPRTTWLSEIACSFSTAVELTAVSCLVKAQD